MTVTPIGHVTPENVSVPEAVTLTGKSRRTIMRAIKDAKFHCYKTNDNHWRIAKDDLMRWAGGMTRPDDTPTTLVTPPSEVLITIEAVELAAAKAENGQLRERLAATEADRDSWKAMAEKLAYQPRRSWWPWGRS